MKCEESTDMKLVPFDTLKRGEVFVCSTGIFMKTACCGGFNAVNLEHGEVNKFFLDDVVIPCNGKCIYSQL